MYSRKIDPKRISILISALILIALLGNACTTQKKKNDIQGADIVDMKGAELDSII